MLIKQEDCVKKYISHSISHNIAINPNTYHLVTIINYFENETTMKCTHIYCEKGSVWNQKTEEYLVQYRTSVLLKAIYNSFL